MVYVDGVEWWHRGTGCTARLDLTVLAKVVAQQEVPLVGLAMLLTERSRPSRLCVLVHGRVLDRLLWCP